MDKTKLDTLIRELEACVNSTECETCPHCGESSCFDALMSDAAAALRQLREQLYGEEEERRNRNPNLRGIGRIEETKDLRVVNERVSAGWRVMMVRAEEDGRILFSLGLPRTLREETIGERRETTDPLQVFELLSTDDWRVLSVAEQPDGTTLFSMGLPKAG